MSDLEEKSPEEAQPLSDPPPPAGVPVAEIKTAPAAKATIEEV